MTCEQIAAWLTLEGWVPWKLHAWGDTTYARSILRDEYRIECSGAEYANTYWAKSSRIDKIPAEWREFTQDELEVMYEKARVL